MLNTVVETAIASATDDSALAADVKRYVTAGKVGPNMIGIAFPGTLIVDRQGRVTSRFFEDYYRERNTTSTILLKVGAAPRPIEGARISTNHLEIDAYPSEAVVAPGERLTLVLQIRPRPGMHVYAPGASGYRVIEVSVATQPFVRAEPVRYPPSETYFFAPLKERVAVYQKPFTLLQDIVVEATADALAGLKGKDRLALAGTLNYQACDDSICFNPVAVPLSWSVELRDVTR